MFRSFRFAPRQNMSTDSTLARLRNRFEFVSEEPGYLAVVILFIVFLALSPKAACSFQDAPASPPVPVETH